MKMAMNFFPCYASVEELPETPNLIEDEVDVVVMWLLSLFCAFGVKGVIESITSIS